MKKANTFTLPAFLRSVAMRFLRIRSITLLNERLSDRSLARLLFLIAASGFVLLGCSTYPPAEPKSVEVRNRINPFSTANDPHRITKESFRLYINSISDAQFNIAVSASDTIARTIEVASGWRKVPLGPLRQRTSIAVLPESKEFTERYGRLSRSLGSMTTEFLHISESHIVVHTTFFSLDATPSIEVEEIFVFTRDQNGWLFAGYDESNKGLPCSRPKVWSGLQADCQKFAR